MIYRLKVTKLNGEHDFDFKFNPDINIFTGKNGCGKTTILKLIWYLVSGNLEQLCREINFETLYFKSDKIEVELQIVNEVVKGYSKIGTHQNEFDNYTIFGITNPKPIIEIQNKAFIEEKSLFFPTFRRVEGGYGISQIENKLSIALSELSNKITPNENSQFIANISTEDIVILLNKEYIKILEKIGVLETIKNSNIELKTKNKANAEEMLEEIKELIHDFDKKKEKLMKPFTILSNLINKIFYNKSIGITKNLTLGETEAAITSEKLSAGEKQMLSFLAYNFFSEKTAIFIDEPELSLHTDWQRLLFPILLEQETDNQFFVATHSPFIYSKYSDKDFYLDHDIGGEQ